LISKNENNYGEIQIELHLLENELGGRSDPNPNAGANSPRAKISEVQEVFNSCLLPFISFSF
jgi:hypothetical protein